MTEIVIFSIKLSTEISQGDVLTYPFFLTVNMWSIFLFTFFSDPSWCCGVWSTAYSWGTPTPFQVQAVQTHLSISDALSCEILFHMVQNNFSCRAVTLICGLEDFVKFLSFTLTNFTYPKAYFSIGLRSRISWSQRDFFSLAAVLFLTELRHRIKINSDLRHSLW